jgi:hypothetical protein
MRAYYLLLIPMSLMAQNKATSYGPPPSEAKKKEAVQEKKKETFNPSPIHVPTIIESERGVTQVEERVEIYTEPGITGMRDGKWVGSDNLFNLSQDLGLAIDIIIPEGKTIPITKEEVKESLVTLFDKSKINLKSTFSSREAATPFLNLMLMVYPVPQGYVAFVGCRLFEEATLKRAELAPGITWQVITWQRETLIVSNPEELKSIVEKTIKELSQEFIDRFKHFEMMSN